MKNEGRAATGDEGGRKGNKVKKREDRNRQREETEGGYMCERLCVLGLDHNLEARC